ncbi:hypothetical protein SLE2022_045390 [Rubroshorea leprosula]
MLKQTWLSSLLMVKSRKNYANSSNNCTEQVFCSSIPECMIKMQDGLEIQGTSSVRLSVPHIGPKGY